MTDILLVLAIIVMVCVLAALIRLTHLVRPDQGKAPRPDPSPYPGAEEFTDEEARAIDSANPPRYQVYRPRRYDESRAPKCTCHGLPLENGEKVLVWPIPNHPEGGMDLFCAETYSQPEAP